MALYDGRNKSVLILGVRGVPGAHGGFETFAEHLAPYLVRCGWHVTVYCQFDHDETRGPVPDIWEDTWQGVYRIHVPVTTGGALGTFVFDWRSVRDAMRRPGLIVTLGYNTAILNLPLRLAGRHILMNMDGIEWRRAKWTLPFRAWFYINDWLGSWIAQDLIADHPRIAEHLATRARRDRITMIPYGADEVVYADPALLARFGIKSKQYLVSICRIEPENSVIRIVRAFCRLSIGAKLVVLGKLDPTENAYHRAVQEAADDRVIFPGAIYERSLLHALRIHSLAYCHGHSVGGTNPSLVEALGAGNAIIALDNQYNRWVAGDGQFYFQNENDCAEVMMMIFSNSRLVEEAERAARARFHEMFQWPNVLAKYEDLLAQALGDK